MKRNRPLDPLKREEDKQDRYKELHKRYDQMSIKEQEEQRQKSAREREELTRKSKL